MDVDQVNLRAGGQRLIDSWRDPALIAGSILLTVGMGRSIATAFNASWQEEIIRVEVTIEDQAGATASR